ncbi:MAG: immunity protein 31 [Candidatus Didemnitutus sp.]|nr:immunity protein 31 [Candidatus Didemnitutus sp.]
MSRFAFYQEVRVARPSAENAAFADHIGAIIGATAGDDAPIGYALALPGHDQVLLCLESELEPTGRQFRREDFYDDSRRIRIRVDERGRGHPLG